MMKKKNYYKPVRVGNFWSDSYVEYESKIDRNKQYQLKNNLIKLNHILIISKNLTRRKFN